MAKIIIHQEQARDLESLTHLCPFGAIVIENGSLEITAGCKMCKLCVKNGPQGVVEFVAEDQVQIDKSQWRGIAVYVEHQEGNIHPVTLELIGKARELAGKIDQPVYALFAGAAICKNAESLRDYGVDEIFVYDHPALKFFRIEPYAAIFEDFVRQVKPSTILVGGTPVGRSLAPRVASLFLTGLTADCTKLDMQPNTDLDQIRPAFGGNIMAHIRTQNSRPQFATVRYKIFAVPGRLEHPAGRITLMQVDDEKLRSKITVLEIKAKPAVQHLEDAEVIVVAGRGLKKEQDMAMIHTLAERLGGQVAGTRPIIEAGWVDPRRQIGLSGRTVKPKLLIACGVSGSVQFTAGMRGAEKIIAINQDPHAPIFNCAHYGMVGDVYEIIPRLLGELSAPQDGIAQREVA